MTDEMKVVEAVSEKKTGATMGMLASCTEGGVFARLGAADIKASTSLLLARFMRDVKTHMKDREEQRLALGKKYGELAVDADNPETYTVVPTSQGGDKANWDAFRAELVDLDELVVDLSSHSFKIRDFRTADKEANIPSVVLQALMEFGVLKE